MIRIQELVKTFRGRRVLDGVDLDLPAGDRIALVGSNGAGKTTMIRCLLGEYVYQGTVEVGGLDARRDRHEVLKGIGFVPQLPPPLKMPVGDLVAFAAGVCGSDPKRMEEVAGKLGLDMGAVRRQPFVKLSGGQKQKLLIGIALGRDSRILILDEPAANLDPDSRRVFFGLLAERQEDVMLISSHRLDEVAPLVNRVIELDGGRVVLDDHVEDTVDLASIMVCTVDLARDDEAFAKALGEWKFERINGALRWRGRVAGPDRLRFLGMLARYAGAFAGIDLKEEGRP
ncbi:MAG: ABC transporter ATP-binding protein [Magnetospirillum sp. WYHS-4]